MIYIETFPVIGKQRRYSEPVEKVSMANPCDFRIVKNQQVASHRKSQNDRIWGFSTASAELCSYYMYVSTAMYWRTKRKSQGNEPGSFLLPLFTGQKIYRKMRHRTDADN
jgi:hypothetical protein